MTVKPEIWRRAVLDETKTIREAIVVLNETSLRIVMVVDDQNKFLGTVGDGDVRRGMLRGLDLDSKLSTVVFTSPLTVNPKTSRNSAMALMVESKIHQIPIVDANFELCGLHLFDEASFIEAKGNTFFILAGGLGTRLRPLTDQLPKPMVKVDGTPMLEHIINRAKAEGFHKFVISVGYLGSIIEEYFKDGSGFGVEIAYLRESKPLGTAGSLKLLNPIPAMPILISNADVITDVQYGEFLDFHIQQDAIATMATRAHEIIHPFGVIEMEQGRITQIEEKPKIMTDINAGIYVLSPSAFAAIHSIDRDQFDMTELFIEMLHAHPGKVMGFPMYEDWIDVGKESDLLKANKRKS